MGKNWAIAVGINNYDNLQLLKYAQRDAEVMKAWFEEEARFDQVFLFTENSPAIPANPPIPTKPTYARFLRFLNFQFEDLEEPLLKPEDNLWFFFAGHGRRYQDQDYLMFEDSDPKAVDRTAISVDYVTQRLRRSTANVVLLLDACRDEGSRGGLGIGEEEHQGVITFYSCTANQQSFEIDQLQHGTFTHALLEGLRLQGEGNCATVERLARYLYQRVPQVNAYYRKQIQNPSFKADPPYKMYFILLKQSANSRDAQPLIDAAQKAELDGDLSLAKNLWRRLWGLPGVDDRAFTAIERIARKQQSSGSSSSGGRNSSTGQRSASALEPISNLFRRNEEEVRRRKQEEAEKKRQQKVAEEERKRQQEAQRELERQEGQIRRQQQEVQEKRQQELDRQRKLQEAQIRREQREQQWQNLQQFLVNRRQFLKWVGVGSGGLVTTLAVNQFFQSSSNSPNNTPITLSDYNFETVRVIDNKGNIGKPEKKESKLFKEDLGNNINLEMVYIPAGKFMMGTEDDEIERLVKKYNETWFSREKPQHQVSVPAFCMGKYPITQAQWKRVAALPKINRELKPDPSGFKGDNRPVERVSWRDAVEFCARLSKVTGREYRLPSEAEWEYACRAGTTTPFHFGETITGSLANYRATSTFANETKGKYREKTTNVGIFPPNAFGLHDMHGNLWEWCEDTWHDNYNGAPTDGSAWVDNNDNRSRLLRGGSWVTLSNVLSQCLPLQQSPRRPPPRYWFSCGCSFCVRTSSPFHSYPFALYTS